MYKVGLALSSGAARGLAHIGVLEVLEKEGIPIHMIAGTSAGALIGALYASMLDAQRVKSIITGLRARRLSIMSDLGLPKTGFIRGKRLTREIKTILGDIDFKDLRLPFACVATDIDRGAEVVINHGSVIEAVRASISIPGIFSVVKWEGKYLVDGGLVNPVPVSVLKDMGADFIIAVNVVPDMRQRMAGTNKGTEKDLKAPNNIFSVLIRAMHITAFQAVRSSLEGADVVIEPAVVQVGFGDFGNKESISLGQEAALKAIPEIAQKLKLSRPS